MMDYTDALAAGWRIFPLHPIAKGGGCGCGNPECQAVGKHPRATSWQTTPEWDADQLEFLEDEDGHFFGNQLQDGYGIVVTTSGLLVVDVDGRNGGWESAKKMADIRAACGYIVQTGSQNGEHWYFKAPVGIDLVSKHKDLPGVDFKSSGYVVGDYSLHASGHRYSGLHGSPDSVGDAPASLINLIKRVPRVAGTHGEIEAGTLSEMLACIPNDAAIGYAEWVSIGMALHHATDGGADGLALWQEWSLIGNPKEDMEQMAQKWHGFGKSASPITAGTIRHLAQKHGYTDPVTFIDNTEWKEEAPKAAPPPRIDLLTPPGLVGEITTWINSRCAYPRPRLAVAAALQIVSNAAGLSHLVAGRNTSLNLITIGIAGSRTGKGAIKRCIDMAHKSLGLAPATHGKFKSSQELVRNAIQHQAVHYVYDEFGKQLEKLAGAGKSGAHYLEDLLAEMIAMYSEATGSHGLSGDMKREMQELAERRIGAICKKLGLADGENPAALAKEDPHGELARAYKALEAATSGLVEPYLTFFALSEPSSFNAALDKDSWLLTGGFLGRALIFEEAETVPREKPQSEVSNADMPMHIEGRLAALLQAGSSDNGGDRVERLGDWQYIQWSADGLAFLSKVGQYWLGVAEIERDSGSDLESQAMGAQELAIKVAGILAASTGTITRVEMEWAHELVKSVTLDKIERARSSDSLASRKSAERGDGLLAGVMRFMEKLGTGEHTTAGRVRNAVGRSKVALEDVERAIEHLEQSGKVRSDKVTSKNGRIFTYLYKA